MFSRPTTLILTVIAAAALTLGVAYAIGGGAIPAGLGLAALLAAGLVRWASR